jgi:hypothetical protein
MKRQNSLVNFFLAGDVGKNPFVWFHVNQLRVEATCKWRFQVGPLGDKIEGGVIENVVRDESWLH